MKIFIGAQVNIFTAQAKSALLINIDWQGLTTKLFIMSVKSVQKNNGNTAIDIRTNQHYPT